MNLSKTLLALKFPRQIKFQFCEFPLAISADQTSYRLNALIQTSTPLISSDTVSSHHQVCFYIKLSHCLVPLFILSVTFPEAWHTQLQF